MWAPGCTIRPDVPGAAQVASRVNPLQAGAPHDAMLDTLTQTVQDPDHLAMTLRLLAALVIGGAIGLERSYHGRPAGFRTHALVCLSTALLMLVTVYETRWFPGISQGRITLDPTRMAQGIMTGIGFLGAGGLAQIECDACTDSMRHDRIPRDKTRRMECVHYRVKDRSIAA